MSRRSARGSRRVTHPGNPRRVSDPHAPPSLVPPSAREGGRAPGRVAGRWRRTGYGVGSDGGAVGIEIERKFRVEGTPWREVPGRTLVQGYLAERDGVVVRVRLDGDSPARVGWLTVKGPPAAGGLQRVEVEVEVPEAEAEALLALCGPRVVAKRRHELAHGGHVWEIDVFEGANAGLVVAEIELDAEDEAFVAPPWLGAEVSLDPRYTNVRLADHPYTAWETA